MLGVREEYAENLDELLELGVVGHIVGFFEERVELLILFSLFKLLHKA